MGWIKLDHTSIRHPKVLTLSDRAFREWVGALCYASEFLTDGHLPSAFVRSRPWQARQQLIASGLWKARRDGSVDIHDYLEYQTARETVEQKRRPGAVDTPAPTPDTPAPIARLSPSPVVSRSGSLIRPAEGVQWHRRHGQHVDGFCDWVCLTEELVQELCNKLPGADVDAKRTQVVAWAQGVREQWADVVIGDNQFDFWRNRWRDTHGSTRTVTPTGKGAVSDAVIAEVFR